jgi:hypothetical protein
VCTLVSAGNVLLFLKVRECGNHPLVQNVGKVHLIASSGQTVTLYKHVHDLGPREGTVIFLRDKHGATNKTGPTFQPFFLSVKELKTLGHMIWASGIECWWLVLVTYFERTGIELAPWIWGKKKTEKGKSKQTPF